MTGKIVAILVIALTWYAVAYFATSYEWIPDMLSYFCGVSAGLGASWFLDIRVKVS